MQIGIGLPNTIPGTPPSLVLEWARRADAGPFSSLATIDRLLYPDLEALVTLAAVAGITERIQLMTTVLAAPLRNPAVLAKQAASLDLLCGGRLTLGLGVGSREDDFTVVGEPFHQRGRRFEEQLELMRRTWSGLEPAPGAASRGPRPARSGGPQVLIGGYSAVAVQRASQWDGYIAGVRGGAETVGRLFDMARQAWQDADRSGKPRLVSALYFGLGADARQRGGAYLKNYYGFLGPRAEQMPELMLATADDLNAAIERHTASGADEVILWPCIPDLEQLDRVREALGR